MTEERRPEETVPPADAETPASESVTAAPTPGAVDAPASESVTVARTGEAAKTHTATEAGETHTMAEIDEENLHSPDRVQQMESIPPYDQKSDVPAEVEELRETSQRSRPPVVDNEKRYGPFSGSMWFLILSVITFVFSLIFAIVA